MVKQKKTGGTWYYEFMIQGKRYFGTCEDCKCRRDAEAFERTMRAKALQGAGLKSVKALYETFREDLTGGKKISLYEAFALAKQKPRPLVPSEKHAGTKRTIWGDFLAFMQGDVQHVTAALIPEPEVLLRFVRDVLADLGFATEVYGEIFYRGGTQNFDTSATTGISVVMTSEPDGDAAVYDLSGRRVTEPSHGIYIQNGKKVVIK